MLLFNRQTKRRKKVLVAKFQGSSVAIYIFPIVSLALSKFFFPSPPLYRRDHGGAAGYSAVAEHGDQSCQADSLGSRISI